MEEKPAEEKKPKKPKKNFDMLLNALQEKERQEVKTKAIQQLLEQIKTLNENFEKEHGNKRDDESIYISETDKIVKEFYVDVWKVLKQIITAYEKKYRQEALNSK